MSVWRDGGVDLPRQLSDRICSAAAGAWPTFRHLSGARHAARVHRAKARAPLCGARPDAAGRGAGAVVRRADLCEYPRACAARRAALCRSEEHTSELQSLMRISYAVLCLKKKKTTSHTQQY